MTRTPPAPKSKGSVSLRAMRSATTAAKEEPYELCLYVAGTTPLSVAAMATVLAVCEERLLGRYKLAVVDVYHDPARAKADQIRAVPTLLKLRPSPRRKLIGDLSDRTQLLGGLGLPLDGARDHDEEA